MAERIDQWPRVHSCLYDWCPQKREDCDRCDAVIGAMRRMQERRHESIDEWSTKLATDLSKHTD